MTNIALSGDTDGYQQLAEPAPRAEPKRHSFRANALALAVGQGSTWLITAVTLALMPRYLGAEGGNTASGSPSACWRSLWENWG